MSSSTKTYLATINGMGFPLKKYPRTAVVQMHGSPVMQNGREFIDEPGYYYNEPLAQIEHWSTPAKWNAIFADHSSNDNGLVCDGFQSVLPFEDLDHLLSSLNVWKSYMDKLGE